MSDYQVEFTEEAIDDLDTSFEWGCEKWGTIEASAWYIATRDSIYNLLRSFPLGHPISPNDCEYEVEIRQLILGRYRVLFNVTADVVTIIHIRGPYSGS